MKGYDAWSDDELRAETIESIAFLRAAGYTLSPEFEWLDPAPDHKWTVDEVDTINWLAHWAKYEPSDLICNAQRLPVGTVLQSTTSPGVVRRIIEVRPTGYSWVYADGSRPGEEFNSENSSDPLFGWGWKVVGDDAAGQTRP